jgi:hypothetical protein
MTRWKKLNPREARRRRRKARDQCVACFSIAWLHEHDHGREFEPLVENLVDAIDGNGYEVWNGSRETLDAFLRDFSVNNHGAKNQHHVAVATAAIERSWERGRSKA